MCASVVQPTCESRHAKYVCAVSHSIEPQPIRQARGDQGAPQPMLERKRHPQISRETQRSDDLGSADTLWLSNPLVTHTENLPRRAKPARRRGNCFPIWVGFMPGQSLLASADHR